MVEVNHFFDLATFTLTYVVSNSETRDAIIIDPVADYEPGGSIVSYATLETLRNFLTNQNLTPLAVLETHAHADHLSGAPWLKEKFPKVKTYIGEKITVVQRTFRDLFHLGDAIAIDGKQFDRLVSAGETIQVGALSFTVFETPGHTPACVSYLFQDRVFCGDALFMPDYGTGRCDFPDGNAGTLYDSITKNLYSLPDATRTYTGHDYMPGGRPMKYESTIGEQKRSNIHLPASRSRDEYVRFRQERDKTLTAPRLLFPSVQLNINGGRLPTAESNGGRYLKIPITEKK